jgi:hypothetical protein
MIELIGDACPAGGKVSGTVSWPPSDPVPSGPVTIWLVWHLAITHRGMFETGSAVREDYAVVSWIEHVAARSIPFEFSIPAEGPVSYAGRFFGVEWEIVVGTDAENAKFAVRENRAFKVVPRPAASATPVAVKIAAKAS